MTTVHEATCPGCGRVVPVVCDARQKGKGRRGKPEGWEPGAGTNAGKVLKAFTALGVHETVTSGVGRDDATAWLNQRPELWHVRRPRPGGGGAARREPWSRDFVQFAISDLLGGGKLEAIGGGAYRPVLKAKAADQEALAW